MSLDVSLFLLSLSSLSFFSLLLLFLLSLSSLFLLSFFSLLLPVPQVMLSVAVVTDYMTTRITEQNDPTRDRMKHLHQRSPHGYLWQRDLFTSQVDLRIDDSLRSLDTLNFTIQYYYGVLLLSTGIVFGYIFIFAYCSVADASSSDGTCTSSVMIRVGGGFCWWWYIVGCDACCDSCWLWYIVGCTPLATSRTDQKMKRTGLNHCGTHECIVV